MFDFIYKYRQVVKFGLVGAANTVFTASIIFLLNKVLGIHYQIANPLSYILPVISSFYFNKNWTFRSEGSYKKEGALFFAIIGIAFSLQYCILIMMVKKMGWDPLVSQLLGMVVFSSFNFLGQKFVAFKQ